MLLQFNLIYDGHLGQNTMKELFIDLQQLRLTLVCSVSFLGGTKILEFGNASISEMFIKTFIEFMQKH